MARVRNLWPAAGNPPRRNPLRFLELHKNTPWAVSCKWECGFQDSHESG